MDKFGGIALDEPTTDRFGGVAVESPSFKDTTDLTGPLLTSPRQPLSPPMPTTVGGGRAPVASAAETLLEPTEEATQPRVQLPRAPIKEGEPFLHTIGKEAYNIAAGIPEFLSSDVGITSMAAGGGAPRLVAGLFSGQMFYDLGKQIWTNYKNWDKMTETQKRVAVVDVLGTGAFALLTGKAAARSPIEAIKPIAPLTAKAVEETIKPEKGEPSAIPIRSPETVPVEAPPRSSEAVGQGTPAPEKVAVPQTEKEVLTHAAYQDEEGNVFKGANHPQILDTLGIEGFPTRESRNTPQFGFTTNKRSFVPREEATAIAKESGQNLGDFEEGHPLHSNEAASPTEPGKTIGEQSVPTTPESVASPTVAASTPPPAEVEKAKGGEQVETIVAAASKLGKEVRTGRVHFESEAALRKDLGISMEDPRVEDIKHGFVTSTGRYVTAKQATKIAEKANQLKQQPEGGDLGSHDLKPPQAPPSAKGTEVVPAKSGEVTPAVAKVQAEVQKVARTEGQRPAKEVKSELVDRLQKAVDEARSEREVLKDAMVDVNAGQYVHGKAIVSKEPLIDHLEDLDRSGRKRFNKEYLNALEEHAKKVTIDIPGDGIFTIWDTKEALQEVLDRAKKISTSGGAPTTVRKAGISKADKEWIERQIKAQPPTTPPSTGEGMALQSGPLLGIDEFINQDVKPFLKKGVDAGKAVTDAIVNWFSPASHAKKGDVDVLFESKGYAEEFKTKAAAAVENANRMMGKLLEAEQVDFIDRVKRGDPQPTPELQAIADLLRKWDDRLYDEASVYKPDLPYIDNHLRVLWKVVPGSPEALGMSKTGIGSKRPWRGSQGFTRRHVLDDMSEGLGLGGVPVTFNPVEMFLLHAQDVMKFVSANRAWEALKKTGSVEFVREGKKAPEGFRRFDDPIAKPYFKTDKGLKAKPGEWWVDEGTARMLHNYLSRDYIRTGAFGPAGRGLLALKNATTAIELGLSPFHAVFESNETMASSLGLGIAKMASGKALEGLREIAAAGVSPATTAKLGGAAIRFAKDEAGFAKAFPEAYKWFTDKYPDARNMIKDLFTGGGQVSMHEDYRIRARKGFEKAVAEGNYPGAVIRAVPALAELANKPLFETYIPRLKVGMFLREYAFELERNSADLASGKMTRPELARKTWSFIEDRFGELNWDNLYWDRTFKTAMQLMFRSVTWKLGNIRGFGKAGRDLWTEGVQKLAKGEMPKMTLPMAWVAGTALVTAIQSSIISKVSTGKYPWELAADAADLIKNLTFPRIDAKDPSQRVSIPTYLRDAVHMAHDPTGYVRSSMTGTWGRLADDWQNKDFYGRPIYNPLDPIDKKVEAQLGHLVPLPFAVSSFQAATKSGASTGKAMAGFAGFTKAPGYISPSAASQVYDMAENWMAKSGDPKLMEQARRQAVKEQRRSDEPSAYATLKGLLKANDLAGAREEYDKLLSAHKRDSIETAMNPHKPFTGSYAKEQKFLATLTPAQRAIYDSAKDERKTVYERFKAMKSQPKTVKRDEFGGVAVEATP